MGVDLVRPSVHPPNMHALLNVEKVHFSPRSSLVARNLTTRLLQDNYGIANTLPQEQEDLKALAEYWRNPGSNLDKDAIDMSTLIMDAIENEDSVLDITEKIGQILDESDPKN